MKPHRKSAGRGSRTAGNALFLILIAVALFAALSYAVTQSGRGGSGGISREQNEIGFAQIEQIISMYQTAVQRMTVGGLPDTQLEAITSGGTWNVSCTTTECRIFNSSGGGITPQVFQGNTAYIRLVSYSAGTDLYDLVMYLPVSQSMCLYFNQRLGITGDVDANASAIGDFDTTTGAFALTGAAKLGGTNAPHLSGYMEGCYLSSNGSSMGGAGYKIVAVLIAR